MHVGAVLVLGTGPGFSVQDARRLLGERSRPLWSATFVTGLAGRGTGLAGRGTGLVIVMNHVLADGIGGPAA